MLPADHPHRAAVLSEAHARPMEIVPVTCRVRRVICVLPASVGTTAAIVNSLSKFCRSAGFPVPKEGDRQHRFAVGTRQVIWEFHTEFVTATWISGLSDSENLPDDIGLDNLFEGMIVGAVRIDVIADATIPQRLIPGFNLPSLCLADIEGDRGQVATDLVPDADKFIRYELASGSLSQLRRSIIVRRLLEIETYRIMALLGLPLARQVSPDLRGIEIALSDLMDRLSTADGSVEMQEALRSLHALSVRTGQLAERLSYRFAAGDAYGDILRQRLAGLREAATDRGSTLTHCIDSRVNPALATCRAVESRLAVLSAKIERAISLLDVRVGVDMQVQSGALLDSIAKTARSQFQLQKTVEGLSTIAITYYLLGILAYALTGPLEHWHLNKGWVLSSAAPVLLAGVWLAIRKLRDPHLAA
jgi:uncharacterized membrane-anchored protein